MSITLDALDIVDTENPLTATIDLTDLKTQAVRSNEERLRLEHNETFDECYLLSIVHSAIVEQTSENWSLFYDCFSPIVCRWLSNHRYRDLILLWDSQENYIAMTFSRFWLSMSTRRVEFASLAAALRYLRATLETVLIDTIRFHLRLRSREERLPEADHLTELSTEDSYDSKHLCKSVLALLVNERQKRLAYLLYYCGLKPRDIARLYSREFGDVKDIYRLNNDIVNRLQRNRDRLHYLLG